MKSAAPAWIPQPTFDWLMEADQPSIKYLTLVYLLDRNFDDFELQQTWLKISKSPAVLEILAKQHPDGYWEESDKPEWPTKSIEALSLLMLLQAPPNYATQNACERLLRNNQRENGGFSYTRSNSGALVCLTGNMIELLTYFGFGLDPRLDHAYQFLLERLQSDKGITCSRNAGQPCLWAAIAALRGLSCLPLHLVSPDFQTLTESLINQLLDHSYDFGGAESIWLKFTAPPTYDLIEALLVLSRFERQSDPRYLKLANILLTRMNEDGTFNKSRGSRIFPLDAAGKPSKIITLNALRVLRPLLEK